MWIGRLRDTVPMQPRSVQQITANSQISLLYRYYLQFPRRLPHSGNSFLKSLDLPIELHLINWIREILWKMTVHMKLFIERHAKGITPKKENWKFLPHSLILNNFQPCSIARSHYQEVCIIYSKITTSFHVWIGNSRWWNHRTLFSKAQ